MVVQPEMYFSRWRAAAAILDFEKLLPFLYYLTDLHQT